jgi:chromate transporter
MAIHLGYLRAGFPGLVAAGAGFILPAMLIVLGLSAAYARYGTTPQAGWLLYGVKPVVLAIIAQALIGLGRKALRGPLPAAVAAGAFLLYWVDIHPVPVLLGGGLLVMLVKNVPRLRELRAAWLPLPWLAAASPAHVQALAGLAAAPVPFSLGLLFLTFLKIGAVLYGSGYVLLAFLRADFVERLGWLTEAQLVDAIALGQVTPGPVFTSATFVGYLTGGLPGALVATLGIFLPSFLFVALTNPLIPRLRSSPWMGALLDGVNAASLGLMAAVAVQLGGDAFVDIPSVLIGLAAALLLFRYGVNTTWLILGGAAAGLLRSLL